MTQIAPRNPYASARCTGAKYGAGGGAGGAVAPYPLASPGEDGGAAHGAAAISGAAYGAEYGALHGAQAERPVDAALVIYRLEEAGMTLLALPQTGYTTRMKTGGLEIVRAAAESYGWGEGRIRPAIPSAARITRMDEALAWIPLIPRDKVVLRRIVGCRALVSPITERHLFSWRRLATVVGADHKAVQRWHAQGVDLIVGALR
jgi:hypothetical protein